MPKKPKKTYQLKVSLQGAKPPIWRRFLVDGAMTLAEFHDVLQIVMGWGDSHLHQFTVSGVAYGSTDPQFGIEMARDERKVRLEQVLQHEKDAMVYEYDFGDGWRHKVTLEKVLPFEAGAVLPACTKGKGACPPEDVGGLWGYYELLESLKDPKHPQHEDAKEWIGEDFDPDAYDLDWVNARLRAKRR
jgi:hypothetical protein